MQPNDETWMRRALELAERGRGHVEPNPLVGAVVVRDGQIVGEGWHAKHGQAHAEVAAFADAGEAARGATLHVTLEPCCHHGKTPPCTDAVLRAGVARVVAALEDPFPQVAGQGAAILRAAGVAVEFGMCESLARVQNAPYLTLLGLGRPRVHAKWAMTLDGRIATHTGDSKWISNESSRAIVQQLRGRMDGVLVGIGTALADDPQLTARPAGARTATRVVLDSQGRLPLGSQLVRTARETPTLVATTVEAPTLRDAGCEVLVLPGGDKGRPDLHALMKELGRRRWSNLLIEGGAEVLGGLMDARLIDEIHVFIAPKLIGGAGAKSPLHGRGIEWMRDALRISDMTCEPVAGDLYLRGALR